MEPRRIVGILLAVLLALLGGWLAALIVTRLVGQLLPGDLGAATRVAIVTLAGYATWATVAVAISAAWLRGQARSR